MSCCCRILLLWPGLRRTDCHRYISPKSHHAPFCSSAAKEAHRPIEHFNDYAVSNHRDTRIRRRRNFQITESSLYHRAVACIWNPSAKCPLSHRLMRIHHAMLENASVGNMYNFPSERAHTQPSRERVMNGKNLHRQHYQKSWIWKQISLFQRSSFDINLYTNTLCKVSLFFFSYIIPPISIFMNGRTVGPEYGKLEARQHRNGKRGILIKPDNAQKWSIYYRWSSFFFYRKRR